MRMIIYTCPVLAKYSRHTARPVVVFFRGLGYAAHTIVLSVQPFFLKKSPKKFFIPMTLHYEVSTLPV